MSESPDRNAENRRLLSVIEIGSTGLRLAIAQIGDGKDIHILERISRPSRLGRDSFALGHISREAMRESLAVLVSFREFLGGYGIEAADVRVFATSALREASNRDTFQDRVFLQTGFRIVLIEDIEESHLMYLAVRYALKDRPKVLTGSNSLILEVGGGTTEVMILRRGRMAFSHSLRFGTVRVGENVRSAGTSRESMRSILEERVRNSCDRIDGELSLGSVKTFILIGSDARFAAGRIGGVDSGHYSELPSQKFLAFVRDLDGLTPAECVAAYNIPWSEAEGFVMGLVMAGLFLARTQADTVVIPEVSIREGLLLSAANGSGGIGTEIHRQIAASAMALGRKYRFGEDHARAVVRLALGVFDSLSGGYGLTGRDRILLETASLLHDIGAFVRASGHHKHGEYIISNSEIFGLNAHDLGIVANIVRYHRRQPPAPSHLNFIALAREDRIRVSKLAAILRVADALDRGHKGRTGKPVFRKSEDRFIIDTGGESDLTLERLSLREKGEMFFDVYGLEPVLE